MVEVLTAAHRLVLVGYHDVLLLERYGGAWRSPRLSWEGVTLTAFDEGLLHGLGWEMPTDTELPFTLDLESRRLKGGAYRAALG